MKKGKKHLNTARSDRPEDTNFPKAEELLEQAFSTSAKISVSRKGITPLQVIKKLNAQKIETFGDLLYTKLSDLSKQMPKMDLMDPFYIDLIGNIADVAKIKQNLAKLNSSARIIKRLKYTHIQNVHTARTIESANFNLKGYQGRVSSVVKKLKVPLHELKEDSKKLMELPTVDFKLRTVVLAGYPNVGKTTLLKRITGSAAQIAPYAFTTKQINIGYFTLKYEKIQVLDTPGLLDRPDLKNPVEKKALAAIKHVARVIVYILDPTLACGWRLDEQIELLHKTTERFPDKKVLVLINKADAASESEMQLALDAVKDYPVVKDGEGFTGKEELLEKITKILF